MDGYIPGNAEGVQSRSLPALTAFRGRRPFSAACIHEFRTIVSGNESTSMQRTECGSPPCPKGCTTGYRWKLEEFAHVIAYLESLKEKLTEKK